MNENPTLKDYAIRPRGIEEPAASVKMRLSADRGEYVVVSNSQVTDTGTVKHHIHVYDAAGDLEASWEEETRLLALNYTEFAGQLEQRYRANLQKWYRKAAVAAGETNAV